MGAPTKLKQPRIMNEIHITNDMRSKLFFTSDMHLLHGNIIRYCNRPFKSRGEMDEELVKRWNSVVPADGIVVNCGDFIFANDDNSQNASIYDRWANRLNGRMFLVRGNHDKIPLMVKYDTESHLRTVTDMLVVVIHKEDGTVSRRILACHYPLLAYPYDYNVYGHVHTLSDGKLEGQDSFIQDKLRWNQYDVGVDQNGYKPVSYDVLCEIFAKRKVDSLNLMYARMEAQSPQQAEAPVIGEDGCGNCSESDCQESAGGDGKEEANAI